MKKVAGYIKRKTMLYKTGVEYGDYTMNHAQGCSHGCLYPCYAFLLKKRFGQIKSYEEWIQPYLVSNTLELLDKEIPKLKDKIKSVQLCFSTDPFMYGYDEIEDMSIKAIEKLNANGIKCTVLTKGILPFQLNKLSKSNEYGITVVSLDENFIEKFEPYSSPIFDRIRALKKLHDSGCKTWVSIEPYPTPNFVKQDIKELLNKIEFVDSIVFGKMNYNKHVKDYPDYKNFYNEQVDIVLNFCKEKSINIHIKKGTKN